MPRHPTRDGVGGTRVRYRLSFERGWLSRGAGLEPAGIAPQERLILATNPQTGPAADCTHPMRSVAITPASRVLAIPAFGCFADSWQLTRAESRVAYDRLSPFAGQCSLGCADTSPDSVIAENDEPDTPFG